MTTMLEAALAYTSQGFKVFPVKLDKKPLTEHGSKDATQLQIRVRELWEKYPDAGIGLVTDGFVVVDFDVKNGGLESKPAIETKYGELPRTRTHRTGGGGLHYIYRNPNGTNIRNTVALGGYQGVDLRANGGYIVAPPSLHESGARYEVLDDRQIAPAPAWLMEMATRRVSAPGSPTQGLIKYGERNHRLFKMAASMRRQGASENTIDDAVKKCYENDCDHEPPITEEELHKIAKQGVKYLPAGGIYQPKESDISLVRLADVLPETVSWLWFPYIPKGKLTLLEGDPGIGKSWVSLAIATAVSLGNGLPGTEATEPQVVLLASAEDGLGDTIRPRLDAMAANVRNIHAIKGALDFGSGGLATLEGYIKDVKPSLVIIDPLVAYIGAGVDIHRSNETRAVMAKLSDMAERYGCAILAIRHLTKGGTLKPIYRGLGSIDFAAACRSVLMAGCDPDNEQKRGIVQIKSNLATKGKAIGFELRNDSFYWTGESDLTAAQILAADSGDSTSVMDEAIAFLRDELASGATSASQVFSDGKGAGLSEMTIKRAKARLGIVTRRQGEIGKRGGGRFTWELPHLEDQKDLGYQEAHIEKNDTLNNSSFKNDLLPKTDDTLNTPCAVLGMPASEALKIWTAEGKPVIYLGPGENCEELEKLLSNPDCLERHLKAIRAYLDKILQRRG